MTGILLFLLVCAVLWLLVGFTNARDKMATLEARLLSLEVKLRQHAPEHGAETSAASGVLPEREVAPPPIPPVQESAARASQAEYSPPASEPVHSPPPLPEPAFVAQASPPAGSNGVSPPQCEEPDPAVDWEKFLGVNLFAWVGGLALFLAVAFFVKYSFEKNLITAQMRVGLGYLTGLGLLIGSRFLSRERQTVTIHTLCATGILILYATTFASHAFYKFFGTGLTFSLMGVVTVAAFLLAVRLDAQVVAVLGLFGGFLTPPLLSTGVDNPAGLFGYLALLDIGLLALALRQRWHYLTLLAAVATVLMQFAWVGKFFEPAKIITAITIFLGFAALFFAGFAASRRQTPGSAGILPATSGGNFISAAAILMPSAALAFALHLLLHPYVQIAKEPLLLFSFVLAADLLFLGIAWLRSELRLAQAAAGGAVFLLLALWTARYLTAPDLNLALMLYLAFALLHSAFPILLQRKHPEAAVGSWIHLYPSLALLLVLVPLLRLSELSWFLWPVVLVIDLVAVVLAVLGASLVSILSVVLLTALLAAAWIFKSPPELLQMSGLLLIVGGFGAFFMGAAVLAARKISPQLFGPTEGGSKGLPAFAQITSVASLMPFLLLTLVLLRLPLSNPSPVFAVALALIAGMLTLVRFFRVEALTITALLSALLIEYVWYIHGFSALHPWMSLLWYLGFALLFLAFPFLFQARLQTRIAPWIVAAVSLPAHFTLIYRVFHQAYPDFAFEGVIPAALAIPCLLAFGRILGTVPAEIQTRRTLLALFGGASLFFITLVFPIQFERQWITIGWALEGAALLWLFQRVPHPGLRIVGFSLLVICFARLALNPWVITEYGRTGTPIWNWYLYAYGIVAFCELAGARLLAVPRNKIDQLNAPPVLYALGTILLFLLMNIEIADCFSGVGSQLTFEFSGDFAQDMAYSLGWAVFAFALLALGFRFKNSPTRYSGMGLLIVTLLKLFLHDLWRLGGLYRIGSLIGLAIILILVSFIYQRFLSTEALNKNSG